MCDFIFEHRERQRKKHFCLLRCLSAFATPIKLYFRCVFKLLPYVALAFSVFPMLSGMDGQLVDGNYYDFSIYSDYVSSGESEDKNVAIAREILLESQAVQYYISMGMSVQYTGQIDEIEGRP